MKKIENVKNAGNKFTENSHYAISGQSELIIIIKNIVICLIPLLNS